MEIEESKHKKNSSERACKEETSVNKCVCDEESANEKKCKCANKDTKVKICDCDVIHIDLVNKAKSKALDEEKLLLISDFYKALSDSTRIKIVDLLNGNELCVCDIAVILNMTKSAVSHQLKNLREMNLIKSRKQGKEVWYSLADDHVREVFEISLEHIKELGE